MITNEIKNNNSNQLELIFRSRDTNYEVGLKYKR
jgi:hypothetical protein